MPNRFYADLHLHSKYSRATSRDLDLEHLAVWGRKKGLGLVATGDFTHPAWMAEIKEKLVPAEPGLFKLRPEIESELEREWGSSLLEFPRFILEVEISTIYKKNDKVRKVHHLIYAPDLAKADRIIEALSRIGNLKSDGRPILGLDSRHLLEITLEAGEGCFLIPAHIWTPWFSVFGSKSGFDALSECYGDLSSEIFALETGLSSDPPMNWLLSALDGYTLVSNSDAHSPPKLGREACLFETELSFFSLKTSLKTGEGFGGTVEFFPEEGKYHLDGHRKCGVRLLPEDTRRLGGLCPACKKPLTVGVMHRVMELADRRIEGPPTNAAAAFNSYIPLTEMISEIEGVGPQSKAVRSKYESLLGKVGSELYILDQAPVEDLKSNGSTLLAEAVDRMRRGDVIREAGYDGEYGTIRLFTKDELHRGTSVGLLFELPEESDRPGKHVNEAPHYFSEENGETSGQVLLSLDYTLPSSNRSITDRLDTEQMEAASIAQGPLVIVAGPGTGKTRTLTHRIAHLVTNCGATSDDCLAITFTKKAAEEMRERLAALLPHSFGTVPVMTFHSLGLSILREHAELLQLPKDFRVAAEGERLAIVRKIRTSSRKSASNRLSQISRLKRNPNESSAGAEEIEEPSYYDRALRERGLVDFDDLLILPTRLLQQNKKVANEYRRRYRWISVDEFQDVDETQYRLVRLLASEKANICVIGDPDQSIYRFRGADVHLFEQFQKDYPGARRVQLRRNYRSTRTIVEAAAQMIAPTSLVENRSLRTLTDDLSHIEIIECATEQVEANFVVQSMEQLIGGSSFFEIDSGRVQGEAEQALSFSDFAVLYRTDSQTPALIEALERSGIPYQKRSHSQLHEQPFVQDLVKQMLRFPTEIPISHRLESVVGKLEKMPNTALAETTLDSSVEAAIIDRLRSMAAEYGDRIDEFVSELYTGVEIDLWDPRADRVSLLTLHASKGLEFPVVFIVGCEDGLLPLKWSRSTQEETAEERRLLFVGMTRAQNRLFLSYAVKRKLRGRVQDREPSPFFKSIRENLLQRKSRKGMGSQSRERPHQLTLFR